jgi:long-chain acyl-CoA synthetase
LAERYRELVDALYDGSREKRVETEMTVEDGRKGRIKANVVIAEAEIEGRAPERAA